MFILILRLEFVKSRTRDSVYAFLFLFTFLCRLLIVAHVVVAKQINRPVREVKENEHKRKGNAREDIDPRATLGMTGEQFPPQVPAARL